MIPDNIRVQYIKLGPGGAWVDRCIEEGSLRLDHREIPHALAKSEDFDQIRNALIRQGVTKGSASSKAREICSFYNSVPTLWITFAHGFLWWCISKGPASAVDDGIGIRRRECNLGWTNNSPGGQPLRSNALSGKLTKTAAYRQTVCDVDAADYLMTRLRDEVLPAVSEARVARNRYSKSLETLIRMLTWQDFETFVDLLFSSSGWRRLSVVGGQLETVDIEVILPTTGERAFVQVKSSTDQRQLDDYLKRFERRGEARMFYAYHTAKSRLLCDAPNVTLLDPERLSDMAIEAGLGSWIIEKTQ